MTNSQVLAAVPSGGTFGYALHRSRMYKPKVIQNQFRLKDFSMMKTFLMATSASGFFISMLDLLEIRTPCPKPFSLERQIVGSMMLGGGMALGGICPGTIFAQLGDPATIKRALMTFVGCLSGAFLYAKIDHLLPAFDRTERSLHKTLNLPFYVVGLAMSGILFGAMLFFDRFERYLGKKGSEVSESTTRSLKFGTLLGLCQVPVNLVSKSLLGASTAFVTIIEPFVKNSYTRSVAWNHNFKAYYQVISDFAAIGGAHLSYRQDDNCKEEAKSMTRKEIFAALASGFLVIMGSRLLGGCTSGMGLSGVAQAQYPGFLGVAGMFAGGIGLAKGLELLNFYDDQVEDKKDP